jgi:hypothetical protein
MTPIDGVRIRVVTNVARDTWTVQGLDSVLPGPVEEKMRLVARMYNDATSLAAFGVTVFVNTPNCIWQPMHPPTVLAADVFGSKRVASSASRQWSESCAIDHGVEKRTACDERCPAILAAKQPYEQVGH